MSKFHDRARQGKSDNDGPGPWFQPLYDQLPEIACVLAGTPKGENGEPAVPGMSIIIGVYQGRLQFTLSRKGSPDMWCGVIEDPGSLLVSLEAALQAGQYDLVQKNSSRAGQNKF